MAREQSGAWDYVSVVPLAMYAAGAASRVAGLGRFLKGVRPARAAGGVMHSADEIASVASRLDDGFLAGARLDDGFHTPLHPKATNPGGGRVQGSSLSKHLDNFETKLIRVPKNHGLDDAMNMKHGFCWLAGSGLILPQSVEDIAAVGSAELTAVAQQGAGGSWNLLTAGLGVGAVAGAAVGGAVLQHKRRRSRRKRDYRTPHGTLSLPATTS